MCKADAKAADACTFEAVLSGICTLEAVVAAAVPVLLRRPVLPWTRLPTAGGHERAVPVARRACRVDSSGLTAVETKRGWVETKSG